MPAINVGALERFCGVDALGRLNGGRAEPAAHSTVPHHMSAPEARAGEGRLCSSEALKSMQRGLWQREYDTCTTSPRAAISPKMENGSGWSIHRR
jgi:hypothetical protein